MKKNYRIGSLVLAIAAVLLLFSNSPLNIFSEPSAQSEINAAWEKASGIAVYKHSTTVIQTTHPTEKLENVGLSSITKRLYFKGETNKVENMMAFKLWSDSGNVLNGKNGLDLKVKDDVAFGRMSPDHDWAELDDDFTEIFAPNNDHLTYLRAAENVQKIGQETRAGITFTRYNFDVDGVEFATFMRDQLEADMRSKGELAPGMHYDLIRAYVNMESNGELWVNEDGLPLRQIVHMKFPPERHALEWYEAEITTDFTEWGEDLALSEQLLAIIPRLSNNPSILIDNPFSLFPQS